MREENSKIEMKIILTFYPTSILLFGVTHFLREKEKNMRCSFLFERILICCKKLGI